MLRRIVIVCTVLSLSGCGLLGSKPRRVLRSVKFWKSPGRSAITAVWSLPTQMPSAAIADTSVLPAPLPPEERWSTG